MTIFPVIIFVSRVGPESGKVSLLVAFSLRQEHSHAKAFALQLKQFFGHKKPTQTNPACVEGSSEHLPRPVTGLARVPVLLPDSCILHRREDSHDRHTAGVTCWWRLMACPHHPVRRAPHLPTLAAVLWRSCPP